MSREIAEIPWTCSFVEMNGVYRNCCFHGLGFHKDAWGIQAKLLSSNQVE